jgi:hypothetical protein
MKERSEPTMTKKTRSERITDYANALKNEIEIAEKKYKETENKIHRDYAEAIGNLLDLIVEENDLAECNECHKIVEETIKHAVEDGYVDLCKECYEKTEGEDEK